MNNNNNNTNKSIFADFVKSNAPYPEIKVAGKNKHYANLLKISYASLVSELTAISQYMYHHLEMKSLDPEIADLVQKIATVEGEHLNMLGQLIILLGEKPIYHSRDGFWRASFVKYGYDILDQLESDLESEYIAIDQYNKIIQQINDRYVNAVLRRIILDEEGHVQFFKLSIAKIKSQRFI